MASDAPVADGRPGAGQLLAAEMQAQATTRGARRDLQPLARLWPFVRAHLGDAIAAALFLTLSALATLGLTSMARQLMDVVRPNIAPGALNAVFLEAGGVALVLSLSTAGR